MKTSTKARNEASTSNPNPNGARVTSPQIEADRKAWEGSHGTLFEEFKGQVEANHPVAMTVSPRVHAEVWRYAAYVMEREGVDLNQAVAHLLEEGMYADSAANRSHLPDSIGA